MYENNFDALLRELAEYGAERDSAPWPSSFAKAGAVCDVPLHRSAPIPQPSRREAAAVRAHDFNALLGETTMLKDRIARSTARIAAEQAEAASAAAAAAVPTREQFYKSFQAAVAAGKLTHDEVCLIQAKLIHLDESQAR